MQANGVLLTARRTFMERRSLLMTVAATGWSIKYLVELGLTHTTGPEIYGVATAAVAVGTGLAAIRVLTLPRWWPLVNIALLALWVLVAVAGVGGTIAHIVGPVAGHGPVDLRPRPIAAPLIFTLLGFVGGAAQVLALRAGARRARAAQ